MAELKELQTTEELEQMWQGSSKKPIILFKHSTTCPISAGAISQYQTFIESSEADVDCFLVKVIEDRNVSNQIETMANVKHESPQIFLVSNKEVVWHTSHSKITADSIREGLKKIM
ncbi:general stress protein [Virgibacillus phasianinus]|uniref:General stress protein n=1 Tax=Virgibacillus phasianinus TaxID=2017483 RepID=A0A220U0Q1_9BACI|nr:bacillithiol system redox-active protein YtxJ [Virgibacillus phasianinus]ASK61503.1 general stress protein [Virgibacillus phasianinus]